MLDHLELLGAEDSRWKVRRNGWWNELTWPILSLGYNDDSAKFTIRRDWKEGYYVVTLYMGNQGRWLGNGAGIESAKAIAENKLQSIHRGLAAELAGERASRLSLRSGE